MIDPDEQPGVSRRSLLAGAGLAATAVWVAPSILTISAAAAGSTLATVTPGVATHVQGNATKPVPLPIGNFTKYLLVISEVSNGGAGALPTLTSGGFTLVTSSTAAPFPNLAVYESTSANPGVPSFTGNDTNGRWTAVVIGFTVGTTVTLGSTATGTGGAISIAGATAPTPSTWIVVGSASDGAGAANWGTISGLTTLLDVSGSSNTPPDLFVAQYTSLQTTVGSISGEPYGPATETAKALQIGVG